MRTLRCIGLVMTLALAAAARLAGQPGSPPPGRAYLFTLDLAGTPLDEFPSAVKALNGTMTVVDKNGQHMLRASSPSEFLITLPQALPSDFTLEVDLIPKSCCNPEDFMLEGTPTRNRGVASAELSWTPRSLMVVGGGPVYQADMPADLAASTPGNLTRLVITFSGTTVKLYTNSRRMFTLDKQFARGRVLRVWLGGQDEGPNAVYLAGFSVVAGAVVPGVTVAGGGQPGSAPTTASNSSGVTGTTSGSASAIGAAGGGSAAQPISAPASSATTPVISPSARSVPTGPRPAGTTSSSAATAITRPPLITNLTGVVGTVADGSCVRSWCPDWNGSNGACIFSWCPDWRQADGACITSWCPDWTGMSTRGMPQRKVTWSWTPPSGVPTAMATFAVVAADPASGQLTTTRLTANPLQLSSGASIAIVEGTTVRICVAGQLDPADPTRIVGPTCLDTQVPGGSPAPGTASQSQALIGPTPLTMTMAPRVTQGAAGPLVQWTALYGAKGYTVRRWKVGDPTCCNNASAPDQAFSPWQDATLLASGTYVYEVTASMTTGAAVVEQTQFTVLTALAPSSPTGITAPTAIATPVLSAPIAVQSGTPVRTASAPPPGSAAAALAPTGPPPTNILVTGTPVLAKLNWGSGISGMRGVTYRVDRWLESNPTCCAGQSATLTFPAWTDEGMQWSGAYVFRITAFYPDGTFGVATTRWVRPDPVNPTNFRAASVSAGSVYLRWDTVPNASWYELSGPGLGYPTFAAPIGAFNVHNLAPGTYTWRVGTIYSSPNAPAPVSSPASAFPSVTVTVP